MAETSYPFAEDTAGGGSKMVSQVQWQQMSHLWASDRIDFQLVNSSYSQSALPFYASFSGSNIIIQPGAAWIGGFYYKLDAPYTMTTPTNNGSLPRNDIIVLRLDMATGSVNLAKKTGTPSSSPKDPLPQRTPGGVWEMPLWAITLAPNNGDRDLSDRRRFDGPGRVFAPLNAGWVSESLPSGQFLVDMDVNNNDTQYEGFRGRDGFMVARHLGRRREYTPDLFTVSNKPASANRKGYWRYTAPGTVQFSIKISNTSTKAVTTTAWSIGFTLPVPTSKAAPTVLYGFLDNPEKRDGFPNFVQIVAKNEGGGNQNCYLHYPNPVSLKEGLDGLKTIPGKSVLTITGAYETNDFD
jgi:hypothetical protein